MHYYQISDRSLEASLFNRISSLPSHQHTALFPKHRLILICVWRLWQINIFAFGIFILTTIGFFMSVCHSVLKEQIFYQCMGFVTCFENFSKFIDKTQVSLKSCNNNGNFLADRCAVVIHFSWFLLTMRNNSARNVEEPKNPFRVQLFLKNFACCEII
jgi:hypothetical protein